MHNSLKGEVAIEMYKNISYVTKLSFLIKLRSSWQNQLLAYQILLRYLPILKIHNSLKGEIANIASQ